MAGQGGDATIVQDGLGVFDPPGRAMLEMAGPAEAPGRLPAARRRPPRRAACSEALVALAFILSGCEVGDPMDGEEEPNAAVTRLALATDSGDDESSDAVDGVDEYRLPAGTYTFDQIKALLVAADPAFADALASVRTGPPPDGAVPAAVEPSSDGPCVLQPERSAPGVEPAPYVPPSWEREVDVFERVAAIPAHDLVTLDEVRAGLAAAAAHDGPEAPTKSPH